MIQTLISIIALLLSGLIAWDLYFKPAKIVGTFPHLTIWTLGKFKGDSPTGEISSRHITPSFWLGNIGAKNILIEDVRLFFRTSDGNNVIAYPTNLVPLEAIETPFKFNDYKSLRMGGPFFGFAIKPSEGWKSRYSFHASEENIKKLKGDVTVDVQITIKSKVNWKTVISEVYEFGSHPIHLQSLTSLSGHHAGSRMNYVLSKSWNERRTK